MALTAKNVSTNRSQSTIHGTGETDPAFVMSQGGQSKIACALWDDSVDGHLVAHATAGMGLGVFLPARAFVIHNFHAVLVVPVGPTNMNLGSENDADLIADAAISGTPWDTLGVFHGIVVRTDTAAEEFGSQIGTATGFGTTAVRELALCGTVAASTAGRVAFYVEFVVVPATAYDPKVGL
jgi:hypothetical protein